MIEGLFNTGSMPVLERLVQFTSLRHQQITHNIANMDTPGFKPKDVSTQSFQETLGRAMDNRRKRGGVLRGELKMQDTRQLQFYKNATALKPEALSRNILFHDRNNRSLEHLMNDLVTNTMAHDAALELMRNQFQLLESAIRERV